MTEIKPCPFCGSLAAEIYEADDVGGYAAHCLTGCGAQTWGDTKSQAITAWNTRVPDPSLLNGLREAREALVTFAACTEQIADDESGQEWAKFRLLVKDYRRAARTLAHLDTLLAQEGES